MTSADTGGKEKDDECTEEKKGKKTGAKKNQGSIQSDGKYGTGTSELNEIPFEGLQLRISN